MANLFDLYQDMSSLSDPVVFEGLLRKAADTAASFYGYTPDINERAVRNAWLKFVGDYGQYRVAYLKPTKAQRVSTALLIRAVAAFPVVTYGGYAQSGNVVKFDRSYAKDRCNELTALTFGISVLSVELARTYRGSNSYAINLDGLRRIPRRTIQSYVETVIEDRRLNFNQRGNLFRRDFYSLLQIVNVYLRHGLPG